MVNKEEIITVAKQSATRPDSKRDDDWNRAFIFGLRDLSARMTELDRMVRQSKAVTAADREITLEGAHTDLSHIAYLLYGTGDDQVFLTYLDLEIFLKKYNSSTATAGTPTYYTVIGLDGGYPKIRFDVPAGSTTTMEVWYYSDMDDKYIRESQSPALVGFTQSYFYGLHTQAGAMAYSAGKNLVAAARANTKPVKDQDARFYPNPVDIGVQAVRQNMRHKR